jgi:hypothetical protein
LRAPRSVGIYGGTPPELQRPHLDPAVARKEAG